MLDACSPQNIFSTVRSLGEVQFLGITHYMVMSVVLKKSQITDNGLHHFFFYLVRTSH